ncbi:unnamed protein product [Blepharisma stoltei]|uniref:Uncharacterized protein n=1 Tax=Blepharisma stoltei TaxID=1481888 RepID=A0AAU9J912_9CILI|nr:unnamed protein product [Blepharisma stoltei]
MGCCQGILFEKSEIAISNVDVAIKLRDRKKSSDEEFEDISLYSRKVTQSNIDFYKEETDCNSKSLIDSFTTNTFTMRSDFESAFLVSNSVLLSSRDLESFIKLDTSKLSI